MIIAGWEGSIAENTRPPRHVSSHRHRAAQDILKKKPLSNSGPSDWDVETRNWVLLRTYMIALYTVRCARHARDIAAGGISPQGKFLIRTLKVTQYFGFTPFDCSDTWLHWEPSVHSLAKERIWEGEGGKDAKGQSMGYGIYEGKREGWAPTVGAAAALAGLMLAYILHS